MPEGGIPLIQREEVLSFEEIYTVVNAAAELGVNKVRLSGGEPLVREGITDLVRMLAGIEGIDDLSLTTNGILLQRYASRLRKAGLRRVNVSLDTLREDRFALTCRHGRLQRVLEGIEAARASGLNPVKINMVVMRHLNDDEVLDFAKKTLEEEWHVRFIELMPFGEQGMETPGGFVPLAEIQQRLAGLGVLQPDSSVVGNGPARYYRLPSARGTLGFIGPVTCGDFCLTCNRMRLTADGKLHPCLLGDSEIDLRLVLRRGATSSEVKQLIQQAVHVKPEGHRLATGIKPKTRAMSQMGG
jgi:cyclic pyranopterin phosphate synthase